jgi:type VI secretion system secreted protein Hcp
MADLDYTLEIVGVDGESKRKPKHIDLLGFSFGATNDGTWAYGSGGGKGKAHLRDLTFTAITSKATAKLLDLCTTGTHIQKAVVHGFRAGGEQEEIVTIELKNALLSSIEVGGSNGSEPTDNCSLNFEEIRVTTKAQKEDGAPGGVITAGWSVPKAARL